MSYPTANDYQKNITFVNENTGVDFGKKCKRKELHQSKDNIPGPGTYSTKQKDNNKFID